MSETNSRLPGEPTGENESIAAGVLEEYGASIVRLEKNQVLFQQGDAAPFFHIVRTGRIKMSVYNEKGREFIQGQFGPGQSFGEPPFFTRTLYPARAVAVEESTVWRCDYESFLKLLADHPDIHLHLTRLLCQRLAYKAMMLSEIAVQEAEHRLRTIIEYYRIREGEDYPYQVPFTRQQLADMTGLRVETVIRRIKGMEETDLLRIRRGKIIWMPDNDSGSLSGE